jgi:hypothetical protein
MKSTVTTVAPAIAYIRERAGRVKTAQRRREVLTRPSASGESVTERRQFICHEPRM